MALVHNPELRDALASAGSGDAKARSAAESVSREIREARETAVADSGRNIRAAVGEQDSKNREEFGSRKRQDETADEVRDHRQDMRQMGRDLGQLVRDVSWMKGALMVMVPVSLAVFAAVVVLLMR